MSPGADRRIFPYVCMLLAAVFLSPAGMLVLLSGGAASPFLFAAGLRIGSALVCLVFMAATYRPLLFSGATWRVVGRNLWCRAVFFSVAGCLSFVLFVWGVRYVSAAVVAVVFGIGPLLHVVLMSRLFRGRGTYVSLGQRIWLLLLLAFAGLVLVSGSSSGRFDPGDRVYLGVGLALGAALVDMLAAYSFPWAVRVGLELAARSPAAGRLEHGRSAGFAVVFIYLLSNFSTGLICLAAGLALGEEYSLLLASGGLAGGLLNGLGGIFWRWANRYAYDLGVNGLLYLSPVFSLVWIRLFATLDVARLDLFLLGLLCILGASMLAQLTQSRRRVLAG